MASTSSLEWYLKVEDHFICLYKDDQKFAAVKSLSLTERDGHSMLKVINVGTIQTDVYYV